MPRKGVPMVRRKLLVAALALGAVPVGSAPADAGGRCAHTSITTARAKGQAAEVEMVEACFTPTLLRVEPGATVSFVNRDPMPHNVVDTGLRWGAFEGELEQGDRFTARFDVPGVYPYACYLHLGMVGAVIVGDGAGPGPASSGLGTVATPADPGGPTGEERATDAGAPPSPGTSTAGRWLPAALGALVGAATVLGARPMVRRRAIVPRR